MKEFRLTAWPELPPPYHRTTYRRMLNHMSNRYVSLPQLMAGSGATRLEARGFLEMLGERGLLREREAEADGDSLFDSLRPLGGWLRQALSTKNSGG